MTRHRPLAIPAIIAAGIRRAEKERRAHVQTAIVWARGRHKPEKQRHDRCIHPSGPHPMHAPCSWFAAKMEGKSE